MNDRIPCTACGTQILQTTFEVNGGLCMPCKGGYRKNIEASKLRKEEEKKVQESPARKYWVWLVNQVHKSEKGFTGLPFEDQLFFAACLVEGEVYNGGFDQYFYNSSADYYDLAIKGLTAMGATNSCQLLIQAKELYFGRNTVPDNQRARIEFLNQSLESEGQQEKEVGALDELFWKDPDNFHQCAEQFARKHGLYRDF